MEDKQCLEILVNMGLSRNQAKIFIVLLVKGPLTIRAVTNDTGLPRESIYRTVSDMQKKGLIQRIISSPTRFKATPLNEACCNLLSKKALEIAHLREETKLLGKLIGSQTDLDQEENRQRFTLISARDNIIQKARAMITAAKEIIYSVGSEKKIIPAVLICQAELAKAISKKVKYYTIIGRINEELIPDAFKIFREKNPFEIRVVSHMPLASFIVSDNKELLISTDGSTRYAEAPCLVTSDAALLELAKSHFEVLWRETKPVTFEP